MSYNYSELWGTIWIIGICTFLIRYVFLNFEPKFSDNPILQRGMRSVPAAMLVALVVPFTLFVENKIDLFRNEVYAIILTIPAVLISKKYGYGLIMAVIVYLILELLQMIFTI